MRKLIRILTSRYSICAAFLLIEVALSVYLAFYAYNYSFIFVVLVGIVNLLVIISLINRDANPEFKLSWLAVVTLVPLLGGAIYIILAGKRLGKRETEKYRLTVENVSKGSGRDARALSLPASALGKLAQSSKAAAGTALSILADDGCADVYQGGEVEYFDRGEELFSAMLKAISGAKRYIFLEYFIVEDGKMWGAIHDVLVKKASEGIEVRMLYDDIGCMKTLDRNYDKKLRREGILCYAFAKITPRFSLSHNNRDHRKICVVDGEYAFTGGVNLADEYINEKKRFGHWKDGGVMVKGEAAIGFMRMFLVSFDFTSGVLSDVSHYLPKSEDSEGVTAIMDKTEAVLPAKSQAVTERTEPISSRTDAEEESFGGGFMIPFGSGPSPVYPASVGKSALMSLITTANDYLYLTTPYLIIDYDLTEALRGAAKRGVDVRIITPGKADRRIVNIMTRSSYAYLISAGVRIFEYTPGFIHEKLAVSDDKLAIVGTINLDYRSLVHHFEDALWMFDCPVIKNIRDSFFKTEGVSREIGLEAARLGFFERVIRCIVRILSPLL